MLYVGKRKCGKEGNCCFCLHCRRYGKSNGRMNRCVKGKSDYMGSNGELRLKQGRSGGGEMETAYELRRLENVLTTV
jgi:hypothetical protein